MDINALSNKILVRILSFLPRSDRLESALTCRRWARRVARAPPLLRDIWLVIPWDQMREAEIVIANSHRQYENLRFGPVSQHDFNAAFWTRIGAGLRKLELSVLDLSPKMFYSILEACSNLESLKITYKCCDGITMFRLSELPSEMNLEGIQKSMRNLRHLYLDFCVDADTLELLFILMPNVSSIALTGFNRESHFLSRLPNMLGTNRKITALNPRGHIGRDDCEKLWRISSASLRSASIAVDELRNCSMLRDLDLYWNRPLEDSDVRLLQNISRNVPELESLVIRSYLLPTSLRRVDFMPIFDLRKLRKLHLDFRFDIKCGHTYVPDGIVDSLSRMISLESLTVGSYLGIVDSASFRILTSMPNLRELEIQKLLLGPECFRIVLFGLRRLRTLNIRGYAFGGNTGVLRNRDSELERYISLSQDRQMEGSSLEVLQIYNIPLSDGSLGRITAQHTRLKIVRILATTDITDAGLVALFQHEPLLEQLLVQSLNKLNGTFLEGLGERCRRLHSLQVSAVGAFTISSQALEEFRLRRPRVKLSVM